MGSRLLRAAAAVLRRVASLSESTVSMASKSSAARLVLLFWRGPMRWYSAYGYCAYGESVRARVGPAAPRAAREGYFSANSWTRFSPKRRWPAAWASSRASTGWSLLTAIRATSEAGRLAWRQAWAIWSCRRARFASMGILVASYPYRDEGSNDDGLAASYDE